MEEPTLRSLIACLEQQLAVFKPWLYGCIFIVAVGCLGEVVSVIREYRDDRSDWKKSRSRRFAWFPDKPSRRWLLFDVFSVILVVVGIGGELYIDFQSNRLETKLRNANGELLVILEKQAGDASKSASSAKTDSETAIKNAGIANETANEAGLAAGTAKTEADTVSKKAKSLANAIGEANREILAQGPRVGLLVPEVRGMKAALQQFAGQKVNLLVMPNARPETYQLESILLTVLAIDCKWLVRQRDAPNQIPNAMVIISEDADADTRKAAGSLGEFLRSVGVIKSRAFETEPITIPERIPKDTINLWIGEHD